MKLRPQFNFVNITKWIYLLMLLALIVDVGGGFGIKHLAVVGVVIWSGVLVFNSSFYKAFWEELTVCVFLTASILYSVFIGINFLDIYYQSSFIVFFALLFILIKIPRRVLISTYCNVLVVGSIIIIIIAFLLSLLSVSNAMFFNHVGNTYGLGMFGPKQPGDLNFPNIYFRWSMWLIPAFIMTWRKRRKSNLLIGVSIVMTTSGAVVAFSFFGVLLLHIKTKVSPVVSQKNIVFVLLSSLVLALLLGFIYADAEIWYTQISSKFSPASESSSIKIGHIRGVLDSISSIPALLFGTGVGSSFYSPGVDRVVINIEPSHFNFLRQYGLFTTLVFFGYICHVIIAVFLTDEMGKRVSVGLLMLFIAAGTNPLLLSPIFMIVLLIARAYQLRYQKECTDGT